VALFSSTTIYVLKPLQVSAISPFGKSGLTPDLVLHSKPVAMTASKAPTHSESFSLFQARI
jgi:hypothetical protein